MIRINFATPRPRLLRHLLLAGIRRADLIAVSTSTTLVAQE
jgi:hypothetical protein